MSLLDITELPAERREARQRIESIWRKLTGQSKGTGLVAPESEWDFLEALFNDGRETFVYNPSPLDENYDAGLIKMIAEAEGAIEMTHEERYRQWEAEEKFGRSFTTDTSGYGVQVGMIADMPIMLSLTRVIWETHQFIVYDMPSTIVDHRMGRRWMEENLPETAFESPGRLNHADAANAICVLHTAQRRKEAA